MTTNSKLVSISALIMLVVMTVGCKSKLTAETTGQITNAVIDRETTTKTVKTSSNTTKKKTSTSTETEISYTYTIDGNNYTGYTEKNGDVRSNFQIGVAVVVCYNPAKPEQSDVFVVGSKCIH